MGLFSKKKNIEVLKMAPQDKEFVMMMLVRGLLRNPLDWGKSLKPEELSVLNDFKYSGIKKRMDEFYELYKNINEQEELYGDNSFVDSLFFQANTRLKFIMYASEFKIQTLTDFKNVYDELIKNELKNFYNQMMCMKVLVDNDVKQFYKHFSQLNNNGNTYNNLSKISKQVLNEANNSFDTLLIQEIIQLNLSRANLHVEKIKSEEKEKKQKRAKKLNDAAFKSTVASINKAEEITRMLEDNEKLNNEGINNKTKQ